METTTKSWVKNGVAVLTALASLVGVAYKLLHRSSDPITATHPFSGFVIGAEGKPVPHARVRIFQDASAAEPVCSDSNGSFTYEIRNNTKNVVLTFAADVYQPYDAAEPAQISVPAQIRLIAQPMASPIVASHVLLHSPTKTATKAKPDIEQEQQAASAAQAPVSGFQNNAPNEGQQNVCQAGVQNCNLAPNQGHQDTYYGTPQPAPKAFFFQQEANAISLDNYQSCNNLPCVDITISAAEYFPDPIFAIRANQTFSWVGTREGRRSNQASVSEGIHPSYYQSSDGAMILALENGPLATGHFVVATVRPSGDVNQFKVVSVTSLNR